MNKYAINLDYTDLSILLIEFNTVSDSEKPLICLLEIRFYIHVNLLYYTHDNYIQNVVHNLNNCMNIVK